MSSLLARLIQAVEVTNLECDGRDLADTLWLAAWLLPGNGVQKGASKANTGAEAPPVAPATEPGVSAKEATHIVEETTSGTTADLYLPDCATVDVESLAGREVRTPAADALPERLAIARALRPLMRRVPSRITFVLDEETTVERIASGDVWTPQFRPAPERRFRVTLIVDNSRSMAVWRRTAHELFGLLRWTGAFREIRLSRMNGDTGANRKSVCAGGDHLILVLSDCVSEAWWDGSAFQMLEEWGQSAAVCLIQVLPESMWARTALRRARGVEFRRRGPVIANARLEVNPIDPWLVPSVLEGLRLPVASLQPGGLGALARLLADPTGGHSRGLVIGRGKDDPTVVGTAEAPAEARVRMFKRKASPTALRLARLVAVSPVVSLQVLRLIRGAMLREASQVHEAEVLLSGLLYALRDAGKDLARTNDVYFRFHDGVSDLLLDGLEMPDWVEVLAKVSEYAERHWGAPQGFRAVLADPTAAVPSPGVSSHPFLRLAVSRLERLGGEYARWARRLSEPTDHSTLMSPPQKIEEARGRNDESASPVTPPGGTLLDQELGRNSAPVQLRPDPFEELDQLVGLDKVKAKLHKVFYLADLNRRRQATGVSGGDRPMLHLAFAGNPGTGKTSVARIVARLYARSGLLSGSKFTAVTVGDLVSGYVGQTHSKAQETLEAASGGVLFIDEAYGLVTKSDNDFTQEVVPVLIRWMTERPEDLAVILADSPTKMQELLRINPALSCRIEWIEFEDYTDEELLVIACSKATAAGERLGDGAERALFEKLREHRDACARAGWLFANAVEVERLLLKVRAELAARVRSGGDLLTILPEDVRAARISLPDTQHTAGGTVGEPDEFLSDTRPESPSKGRIFISYRRPDSEHVTGRIYDHLEVQFGRDNVFMNIEDIAFGVNFHKAIDQAVSQCDVLLAVIGEQWSEIRHHYEPRQGQRRLDDVEDFVRIEIQSALTHGIPVIPVLVGKARMPAEKDLPDELKELAYRQAAVVRSDPDFRRDVAHLIQCVKNLLREPQEETVRRAEEEWCGRANAEEEHRREEELARMVYAALERTGGHLSAEDTAAANELIRRYPIDRERAKSIIDKVQQRWASRAVLPPIPPPQPTTVRATEQTATQGQSEASSQVPVAQTAAPEPKAAPVRCPEVRCGVANPPGSRVCLRCGGPLPLPIGTLVHGRYRIDKLLKIGGFGAVYRGADTRFGDRPVAIKDMINTEPAEFELRRKFFRREAVTLRILQPTGRVPEVYDFFEEADVSRLVLEFIPGENLLDLVQRDVTRPFPVARLVEWGKAIRDVLDVMHRQASPLVHRDIKPDNFMLLQDQRSIKMIDFGASRELGYTAAERAVRMTGIYTEGYAPPEQMVGKPEVRSDLFGLAATLYQLATGKEPHGFQTVDEIAAMLADPAAPIAPQDRWFYQLLQINLAEDVRCRYPSARAIKADLEAERVTVSGATHPTPSPTDALEVYEPVPFTVTPVPLPQPSQKAPTPYAAWPLADPFAGFREACRNQDWPMIMFEAGEAQREGHALPADLSQWATDARLRMDCFQKLQKALAEQRLQPIVEAYRPELVDDWMPGNQVARAREALACWTRLEELRGLVKTSRTGQTLLRVWSTCADQLEPWPESVEIITAVRSWAIRNQAWEALQGLTQQPAPSERAIVQAAERFRQVGGHPDARSLQARVEQAARRAACLERLPSAGATPLEQEDALLLRQWDHDVLDACPEAQQHRPRLEQANQRLELVAEVQARIAQSEHTAVGEQAIVDAAQRLPADYVYAHSQRVETAQKRLRAAAALEKALSAPVPNRTDITAGCDEARRLGLRLRDPRKEIPVAAQAGHWHAVIAFADEARYNKQTLSNDLLRHVSDAQRRVDCHLRLQEAWNGRNLQAIADAYQPALLDDWIPSAEVLRSRQALEAWKKIGELRGLVQTSRDGEALLACWRGCAAQVASWPESEPIREAVRRWEARHSAWVRLQAILQEAAPSEKALARAWDELQEQGGHPDAAPFAARAQQGALRAACLERLPAANAPETQQIDEQFVRGWDETILANCPEAQPHKARHERARERLQIMEQLEARIVQADQKPAGERAIVEIGVKLKGYAHKHADRIRVAKARVDANSALDRALGAGRPSAKELAAAYDEAVELGLRIDTPRTRRCQQAKAQHACLQKLASIDRRQPRDIQDREWLARWDEELLRDCPDADALRTEHDAVRARVAAWRALHAAVEAKDLTHVSKLVRHPLLVGYPPLVEVSAVVSDLLEQAEALGRVRDLLGKEDPVSFVEKLDFEHVRSHPDLYLPHRKAIEELLNLWMQQGEVITQSQQVSAYNAETGLTVVRWMWRDFGRVTHCKVAVSPRRFFRTIAEADGETMHWDPEAHRRAGGGIELAPVFGKRPLFVTVWPVIELGWTEVVGRPLHLGPIKLPGSM